MTLDDFLETGTVKTLGSHLFTEEAIIAFASKYDPQPFHTDPEAAKSSIFGGLCASGWHTASVWMRMNLLSMLQFKPWTGDGPAPTFGPSPGFENLKWPRPTFAGDELTYTRQVVSYRDLASRPGWIMLSTKAGATNQHGESALEFDSAVLMKVR